MPDRPLFFEKQLLRSLTNTPTSELVSRRLINESTLETAKLDLIVKRFRNGKRLDETETMLLYSIISPNLRPAIPVLNNLPEITEHPLWPELNEIEVRALLETVCKATGRIEYSSGAEFKAYGTGFLVADDLIMTNRHVADIFSMPVQGFGHFLKFGYTARINFCREKSRWDTDPSCTTLVTEVIMLHPWFDLALLRIESAPDGVAPLSLSVADADTVLNTRVGVVGYPSKNPDEDTDIQQNMISEFDTKHISPGFVNAVEVKTFQGKTSRALGHDSSTLTGNSGSPLVDLETGIVVGLHFKGNTDGLNWAVPSSEIASDIRMIDAGVVFDGVAVAQAGPWDTAWAVV